MKEKQKNSTELAGLKSLTYPTIEVIAVITSDQGEPRVALRFDGLIPHQEAVEIELGAAQQLPQFINAIAKKGYPVPTDRGRRKALFEQTNAQLAGAKHRFRPSVPGWHARGETMRFSFRKGEAYGSEGDVKGWQAEVGKYLPGNDLLLFASFAFPAAMILRYLVPEGSPIFHFVGPSRSGKTTALDVASSICQSPAARVSWNATSNALLEASRMCRDSICVLDELGEGTPSEIKGAIYTITNGAARMRLDQYGGLKSKPSASQTIAISSGEIDLRAALVEAGLKYAKGYDARFIPIPVDQDHPMVAQLHGLESARELIDHLKRATRKQYGTVGRELAAHLTSDWEAQLRFAKRRFANYCDRLRDAVVEGQRPVQFDRLVPYFAAMATGGAVAIKAGLYRLEKVDAFRVAAVALRAWAARQLEMEKDPQQRAVDTLIARLDHALASGKVAALNEKTYSRRPEYPVFTYQFRAGLTGMLVRQRAFRDWFGASYRATIDALKEAEVLVPSSKRGPVKQVRVPDLDNEWVGFYVINRDRLDELR